MTDGIRDALGMDSKNRENRDGETVVEASELRTLRRQLHQERERAEQAESRCNHLTNECAKLARRNAEIEKERDELREVLSNIIQIPNYHDGGDWIEIEEAREIARRALGEE